ncbi:MAG TPA: hypothetical protein ENN68_02105 [Methanomicrobia archaeon]|nr:hypothetical protein [Methanomicrobia archaeon]
MITSAHSAFRISLVFAPALKTCSAGRKDPYRSRMIALCLQAQALLSGTCVISGQAFTVHSNAGGVSVAGKWSAALRAAGARYTPPPARVRTRRFIPARI